MLCTPLRGVRAEPLTPTQLSRSPMRALIADSEMNDTSLDDEFAAQQREHDDAQTPAQEVSLRELAAEMDLVSSMRLADDGAHDTIAVEDEEEEARPALTLPTPTPHRHTPSFHVHTPHGADASTLSTTPLPAMQLITPPSHTQQQLNYRGEPIDYTMRRNLLANDTTADFNQFRAAAAASLAQTTPLSLTPYRMEAQQAALAATPVAHASSPARAHSEYDADVYAENELVSPSMELQVEQSAVEEASDAVEEMGACDELPADEHDGNNAPRWDAHSFEAAGMLRSSDLSDTPAGRHASFAFSPIASCSSTPFLSPVSVAAHSASVQPRRTTQHVRDTVLVAMPTPSQQLLDLLPAAAPANPFAPADLEWGQPQELAALASKQMLRAHSRYGPEFGVAEKRRQEALLAQSSGQQQPQQRKKLVGDEPLAKQRATPVVTSVTAAPTRSKMQSSLALIKRKAAAKRSTPPTSAAKAVSTVSTSIAAVPARSHAARPAGRSTLTSLSRVPLAALPLSHENSNPWISAREQAQIDAAAIKAAQSRAHEMTTPRKASAQAEPTSDVAAEAAIPVAPRPSQLHALPPPLSPPSQPAQTYRALVNGVHVIPPALSWVATHAIAPDRIRSNLHFLLSASCVAEGCA